MKYPVCTLVVACCVLQFDQSLLYGQNASGSPDGDTTPAMRGYISAKAKKWDEAISNLTEAVRLNPQDVESSFNLGNVYFTEGDFDSAITYYTKVIGLRTNSSTVYDNRGIAYARKGDYARALADFGEAIRISPGYERAYYNRGKCFADTKEFDKAMADFSNALKLEPDSASALCSHGLIYIEIGEWQKADVDLEAAIQNDASDVEANNGLAWLLATCPNTSIRNGRRAVKYANKACELSRWQTWYCVGTLAAAYAETDDFEQALKYQRIAMNFKDVPTNELAEQQMRLKLYEQYTPYRLPVGGELPRPPDRAKESAR
jgi:tetratricopeptide (TPR) repeat protein